MCDFSVTWPFCHYVFLIYNCETIVAASHSRSWLPALLPWLPGSKNYSWLLHATLLNSEEPRRTVCCQLQLLLPSTESEGNKLEIETQALAWNDFHRLTLECIMETFKGRKVVDNAIIRRATSMMRNSAGMNSFTCKKRFRHIFRVTPKVASILWMKLDHCSSMRAQCNWRNHTYAGHKWSRAVKSRELDRVSYEVREDWPRTQYKRT